MLVSYIYQATFEVQIYVKIEEVVLIIKHSYARRNSGRKKIEQNNIALYYFHILQLNKFC